MGSLFAGIGGFDLAAERAGMTVVWQSELDPHASRVLATHWPHVKNLGDIHGITTPPAVDVLCGGFPCQDYSLAGNRAGLAGDRGALWWEMDRLIGELRPAWVVGENVPGLLSSRGGADFETIIRSLTQRGYGVAWAVLDAQYFGVAQRRRRVFIVGHSGGIPRPEILALAEGMYGHPEPRREAGERTAPTLASRTRGGGFPGTDEAIDGAVVAHGFDEMNGELNPELHHSIRSGTKQSTGVVAFNWQTGQDQLSVRSTHTDALHAGQTPAVAFAQNQRMKQQTYVAVHPALTAQPSGLGGQDEEIYHAVLSPTVRRLTPLECERLQGFPDGWTAIPGNSDTQRYRQLGNAVAVPVVEWIMRRIAEATTPETSQATTTTERMNG